MRLVLGALATVCLLTGTALILRTTGLLTAAGHGAGQWWPAFLLAAGVAIILRSVKLGPHIVVSIGLMGGGGLAFAITHHVASGRMWVFVATGGLVVIGIVMAGLAANAPANDDVGKSRRIFILLRAAELTLRSSDLDQVRVFLICGRLELNLEKAISPKQRRDSPVMVDVTVWIGKVQVIIQPGVESVDHKAFVMRFNRPLKLGILTEEKARRALVIVASLAFFGNVEIKEATGTAASVPGG
jgi:hypothetical protein